MKGNLGQKRRWCVSRVDTVNNTEVNFSYLIPTDCYLVAVEWAGVGVNSGYADVSRVSGFPTIGSNDWNASKSLSYFSAITNAGVGTNKFSQMREFFTSQSRLYVNEVSVAATNVTFYVVLHFESA